MNAEIQKHSSSGVVEGAEETRVGAAPHQENLPEYARLSDEEVPLPSLRIMQGELESLQRDVDATRSGFATALERVARSSQALAELELPDGYAPHLQPYNRRSREVRVKCGSADGGIKIEVKYQPGKRNWFADNEPARLAASISFRDSIQDIPAVAISAPGQRTLGIAPGSSPSENGEWSHDRIQTTAAKYLKMVVKQALHISDALYGSLPLVDLRESFELELVTQVANAIGSPGLPSSYAAQNTINSIGEEVARLRVEGEATLTRLQAEVAKVQERVGALNQLLVNDTTVEAFRAELTAALRTQYESVQANLPNGARAALEAEIVALKEKRDQLLTKPNEAQGRLILFAKVTEALTYEIEGGDSVRAQIADRLWVAYSKQAVPNLSPTEFGDVFLAISRRLQPCGISRYGIRRISEQEVEQLETMMGRIAESLHPEVLSDFTSMLLLKSGDHPLPEMVFLVDKLLPPSSPVIELTSDSGLDLGDDSGVFLLAEGHQNDDGSGVLELAESGLDLPMDGDDLELGLDSGLNLGNDSGILDFDEGIQDGGGSGVIGSDDSGLKMKMDDDLAKDLDLGSGSPDSR
jgi:hypothetical protein